MITKLKVDKFCKFTTLKSIMTENLDYLGQSKKKQKTE